MATSTHKCRMVASGRKGEAQGISRGAVCGSPHTQPTSNFYLSWSEREKERGRKGRREGGMKVPEPLKPGSTSRFRNLPPAAPSQASQHIRSNKYQARLSVQSLRAEPAGRQAGTLTQPCAQHDVQVWTEVSTQAHTPGPFPQNHREEQLRRKRGTRCPHKRPQKPNVLTSLFREQRVS